jgi:hypothetical protein
MLVFVHEIQTRSKQLRVTYLLMSCFYGSGKNSMQYLNPDMFTTFQRKHKCFQTKTKEGFSYIYVYPHKYRLQENPCSQCAVRPKTSAVRKQVGAFTPQQLHMQTSHIISCK